MQVGIGMEENGPVSMCVQMKAHPKTYTDYLLHVLGSTCHLSVVNIVDTLCARCCMCRVNGGHVTVRVLLSPAYCIPSPDLTAGDTLKRSNKHGGKAHRANLSSFGQVPFFCCNGLPYTGTLAHMVELENERMVNDRVIVG